MTCPKCKATVQPSDETSHGFHEDCYSKWIAALYEELRGWRVAKVAHG